MSNRSVGRAATLEDFESYRPLLFSIAYRMLGSASEADDIVQEAYLRYRTAPAGEIHSLKAYLSTVVTHLCLDYLKSAHAQREQYIGPWLPEPVLTTDSSSRLFETAEQHESIALAFLVLLETLNPAERAVFLLHEVFDYTYQEIAEMLGKSSANCRQLCHRAKEYIAGRRPRFMPSREAQLQLMGRFLKACQEGDVQGFKDILAEDVINWSDGGGKAVAARRPICGDDEVIRFWLALSRKRPANFSLTLEEVNGAPAFLLWIGETLLSVVTFEVNGNRIQGIRNVMNPDKLAYILRQLQGHSKGAESLKSPHFP